MEQKSRFYNYNNYTSLLSFDGINDYSRVIDIIDGDTIVVILQFCCKYYKIHVRLNGIDTCEMKSKNEYNKEKAINAKNRVFKILTGKDEVEFIDDFFEKNIIIVWIECKKFDKYGRLLANIYAQKGDEKSLSTYLLEEYLAYKYTGGKKLSEEEQRRVLDN